MWLAGPGRGDVRGPSASAPATIQGIRWTNDGNGPVVARCHDGRTGRGARPSQLAARPPARAVRARYVATDSSPRARRRAGDCGRSSTQPGVRHRVSTAPNSGPPARTATRVSSRSGGGRIRAVPIWLPLVGGRPVPRPGRTPRGEDAAERRPRAYTDCAGSIRAPITLRVHMTSQSHLLFLVNQRSCHA